MFVELFCLAFLVFLIYHIFFEYNTGLPPGPRPWPLIGNAGLMNRKRIYMHFAELEKEFGNVFSLYMGHKPMVVLSGDAIREAFVRQSREFADRPPRAATFRFKEHRSPTLFFMGYGPAWRLFRKLAHSTLKVYGQEHLHRVIDLEVDELCKRLENLGEEPSDISKELGMSVTNIICNQLFGSRYEIHDPEFIKVYEAHQIIIHVSVRRSFLDFFPLLKKLLPESDNEKKVEASAQWRDDLLKRKYLQHLETFDPNIIRDYTDAMIKAKLEAEEEDSSCKEYLTQNAIVMAGLATLFLAGSETTSTTLGWAVLYLIHNPDIQDRLHQEIDQVIGREEVPKLSSKKSLPLLEAFTAETLRMSSVIPLSVPHQTTSATTFRGYEIPKGILVLPNLWSLHHDPTIWKDPFQFSLERFLDEEGSFVNPPGGTLLPFSTGARVCTGEVFARSELFLFLSRLLQKFTFENPPNTELPCLEQEQGTVTRPKPYKVCVKKRK